MEKKIKIKSTSLSPLNETLQKLKLNDTIKDFTPVIVEADGKFTSIMNAKEEFNPNDISSTFETEEQPEENKETKEQLLNQAKDALKQTLTNSKELNDILKKIQDLSKEDGYNIWELNKENNTASLKSKNATIFKQNDYLCLAHNGKIELFKSVPELHEWLKDKGYPLPGNDIIIHESVEVKEAEERNWLDLLNDYNDKKKDNLVNNISQDDKPNPDLLYQGLGKMIDKKTLQADRNAKPIIKPNRSLLKKEADVEECCGGACVSTAALGPAVAYTASPKKKEEAEEELQEAAMASIIPDENRIYGDTRQAVNAFLTWYKRNAPSVKNGDIKLPEDFVDTFDNIIVPKFTNNSSDSMSKTWLKIITNRLKTSAINILEAAKKNPNNKGKTLPSLEAIFQTLINKPNEKICNALEAELNSYIPDDEKYAFGKVKLVPGESLLLAAKGSPNFDKRLEWQKAGFQAKLDGKAPAEANVRAFSDLKNFVDNNLRGNHNFTAEELDLIKKYNLKPQTESIFESANKYPWLNKILGKRLVEDDTPADFATGSPISSDMSSTDTTSTTTSSTTTDTTTPDIDFGGDTGGATPSFGDINIDAGGYSPDEAEDAEVPMPNMPEYKIIDVLLNDDNNDIKVKIQNQDTKETEIKDLEDIDV